MPPETRPTAPPTAHPSGPPGSEDRRNVIHDIGYRHYDGPRLGRSYARRSLFTQSLRGAYGLGRSARTKVLPMILFAAMCLPAGIIVAVTVFAHLRDLPVEYTRYAVYLQAVIGLFLASQAPQAVSRDLRFGTMPLYFSRPAERVDYVVAKFAALTCALLLLTGTPLVILYLGSLLAKLDFGHQTAGFAQGMVAAVLLSLLFAGIGLVIAALTPRRGFGVAAVIAAMTVPYAAVSAVEGIAYARGAGTAETWVGLFSPITLVDGVQSAFLGATPATPGGAGPSAAVGCVYLLLLLAAVAGSYALLLRRYRKAGL
ncbi:ABC transporter permease [Streptomyces sp. NPDC059740]|uniref:ABC transporter permease n=1 Tax=Streptomyces sp. NPDC059740 TaxID=3346926 RepID=UPI00364A6DCF